MSSSPVNSGTLSKEAAKNAANNERARLTDREKKQNHILSEQKRRQAIRAGFDRLATLIPGMTGQGRSEAVVLAEAVQFEILCQKRKAKLEKLLLNKALTRNEFETAYQGDQKAQRPPGDGVDE